MRNIALKIAPLASLATFRVTSLVTFRARGRVGRKAEAEAGFTLVEMLVVIAIIALVVGLVGPRVLNYLGESKEKAAKIQIESFSAALDLYYLDNGGYPTASEGLAALVKRPPSAPAWNGPYLKSAAVPPDPWGHPYLYKTPGDGAPFEIDSFGPTGEAAGQSIIRSASR